jgi:hypothetical protein
MFSSRGLAMVMLAACSFRPGGAGTPSDGPKPTADVAMPGSDAAQPDSATDASSLTCLERWAAHDVAFDAGTLLTAVSAPGFDTRDPFVSYDELTMYFDSNRPGGLGGYDLWISTRTSTGSDFPAATDLPTPINSPSDESKLATTLDELDAVFSSDRPGTNTGYQLWESTRSDPGSDFGSAAQTNELNLDVAGNQYDPWLGSDGNTIFFAPSPQPGVQQIASASRPHGGVFGSASVVAALEDAAVDSDCDPTLTLDKLVILFSSSRASGVGQSDLYYATRATGSDAFGSAELVPDVNTITSEADAHLTADGCRLYFTSDRDNGAAGDEIYFATMQ